MGGLPGQLKLAEVSVLVVGAGGIGATVIMYLAGSGIGRLGIIDGDKVDESNLHRQILYGVGDIGREKSVLARAKVESMNPYVECLTYTTMINASNAIDIIRDFDIVVDATDNFKARYLINDACVILGKPLVSGASGKEPFSLTHCNDFVCLLFFIISIDGGKYYCFHAKPGVLSLCESKTLYRRKL